MLIESTAKKKTDAPLLAPAPKRPAGAKGIVVQFKTHSCRALRQVTLELNAVQGNSHRAQSRLRRSATSVARPAE
jgi:hypothetical protein